MKVKYHHQQLLIATITALVFLSGCEKLLNEPSDKSLAVPSSLEDLQALLENPDKSSAGFPAAGEESADDYYLTDEDYQALYTVWDQRRYIWADDDLFAQGGSGNPWYSGYFAIYGPNAVLDFLPNIEGSETETGKYIKGQALFWRAFHYYEMAQVWTLPYDAATASKELGLPLRLDPDFNKPSIRSSLAETYEQILEDLKAAVPLLTTRPIHSVRASRQGAYGVLARVFLAMRDYDNAGKYADSCLQIHSELLDFNTLDASDRAPIKAYNHETITAANSFGDLLYAAIAKVNPQVYALYQEGDLRKQVFFETNPDGTHRFKGNFMEYGVFNGIATGEMLLIRAECYARAGKVSSALEDLNTLLRSRWDKDTPFVPYVASTAEDAKKLVLTERRRELIMRGLRWSDIRRLNLEGAGITQTRTANGKVHTLLPNDPRYALALPEDVIERSGMVQNRR